MNFSHSPSFPPSLNFLFLPHGEVNITYQRLVAWGKCFKIFLMLWSLISGSPKGKKNVPKVVPLVYSRTETRLPNSIRGTQDSTHSSWGKGDRAFHSSLSMLSKSEVATRKATSKCVRGKREAEDPKLLTFSCGFQNQERS